MACVCEKALVLVCLHLSLWSVIRGENGAVHWAVKVGVSEERAREIASERGLEFVGRVDPFPDVFEMKLSREAIQARTVDSSLVQSADDVVHDELSGHPDVKWASKQIALKRVKRDFTDQFSDPAFGRQWHLVLL